VTAAELQADLPRYERARAVFFDRDGTHGRRSIIAAIRRVRVFPGVPEALRKLKAAGFRTFIITNQSGIARGLITEAQSTPCREELLRQIGAGLIDATFFCADPPAVPSTRRKPEPGMVLEAAAAYDIDWSGRISSATRAPTSNAAARRHAYHPGPDRLRSGTEFPTRLHGRRHR